MNNIESRAPLKYDFLLGLTLIKVSYIRSTLGYFKLVFAIADLLNFVENVVFILKYSIIE